MTSFYQRKYGRAVITFGITLAVFNIMIANKIVKKVQASEVLSPGVTLQLPNPQKESEVSIEEAMYQRGSVREYADTPLTLEDISQLMWAAQGVNQKGTRTAPSAGALYPLNVYLISGATEGLEPAVYLYLPESHELELRLAGDYRSDLSLASLSQEAITAAPATIVLTGEVERLEDKYGYRSERYMLLEAGHVAQNMLLQSVSLDLGIVSIGAFSDQDIHELLQLADGETVLYVIPTGKLIN